MTRVLMRLLGAVLLFVGLTTTSAARADDSTWTDAETETWRMDAALTFNRFEQQVKSEVGGATADPIVEESSGGFALNATYNVWRYFRLGLYAQLDLGQRHYGRFTGLAMDGTPQVERSGGRFLEFWLGPLLRIQWRGLFVELGYGALGIRSDDARLDLPSEEGDTGSAFRTSPRIAWSFGLGGFVPVHPRLDVVFRLQYRVRYYTRRGGSALEDGVVHGTQNLAPFVGISFHLGQRPPEAT